MKDIQLAIARLFSTGKFAEVAHNLSENVEFHIYEDDQHLIGKEKVLDFCNGIAAYFASIDTDFQELGNVVDVNSVVIYGYGEFKRHGVLVNTVHSCDVYEFDGATQIVKIISYCNSAKV